MQRSANPPLALLAISSLAIACALAPRLARADDERCTATAEAAKRASPHAARELLALGDCHEKAGRTASAWAAYRQAEADAAEDRALRAKAEAAVARVEPALARVRIVVAPTVGSVVGLSVKRGDEVVGNDAWGIAVPVDPGKVVVQAEAPGKRRFVTPLEIAAGDGVREVRIDALEALPPKPEPLGPPSAPNPLAEPIDDPRWGRLGTAGAVIGGVGLATLTVSLGLALKASSDHDDALANPAFECARDGCNASGDEAVEDAEYLGDVAKATALIGATLTAVGATMVIIELAAPVVKQQSIALGFGPGMLVVRGSFR